MDKKALLTELVDVSEECQTLVYRKIRLLLDPDPADQAENAAEDAAINASLAAAFARLKGLFTTP